MNHSMTAYASQTGYENGVQWMWEVRSVNARGLDVRLRLPDGCDVLDAPFREALKKRVQRGNVTATLRITLSESDGTASIDSGQLDRILSVMEQIQERAFERGVALATPTVTEVLAQRGVMKLAQDGAMLKDALPAIRACIEPLIDEFVEMRQREGAALSEVILSQLQNIATTITACDEAAEARRPETKEALTQALRRILDDVSEVDEQRIAQELALLTIKQDITEELDRLRTHVAAAKEMLDSAKPMGRKLDFLAQEFSREANTLCSKAQNATLTAHGLDLKAFIDQMREQIQNLE
jgi:uncharacterized protein (TIGR00255 family)